jgi:hypothetical protein
VRAASIINPDETSVENYFTRQYIPEDNSELHTRCREISQQSDSLAFISVTAETATQLTA